MRIGAHTSIAKSRGNAELTAAQIGGNTFQIFPASPRMWRASPPAPSAVKLLQRAREKNDLYPLVIHDNHLINLVSCSETLRVQSRRGTEEKRFGRVTRLGFQFGWRGLTEINFIDRRLGARQIE